ncbi:hypothetical protein FHR50_001480 [Xanthomonas arboricola]
MPALPSGHGPADGANVSALQVELPDAKPALPP